MPLCKLNLSFWLKILLIQRKHEGFLSHLDHPVVTKNLLGWQGWIYIICLSVLPGNPTGVLKAAGRFYPMSISQYLLLKCLETAVFFLLPKHSFSQMILAFEIRRLIGRDIWSQEASEMIMHCMISLNTTFGALMCSGICFQPLWWWRREWDLQSLF